MAGHIHPLIKSRPSTTSSNSLFSYKTKNGVYYYKPSSWLLVLLIFFLSLLTFFRQWKNGDIETVTQSFLDQQPLASSLSPAKVCDTSTSSSSPVSPVFKGWKFYDDDFNLTRVTPKICITSTTSAGLEEVLPWIYYHKVTGISNFFLFVEGKAANPNVSKVLETIPGVKVIPKTRELEDQQAQRRLQQAMQQCIVCEANPQHGNGYSLGKGMDSSMEWILHVDTDELLYPGGTRNYSMRELLANIPSDIDVVIFPNYESAVERDDIQEPFYEVSLFKKNFDHLPNDSNFELYKMATRGNPNYFLTYANGKSAARIQDHLRPNGAHQWYNYFKEPKEIMLDEAAILHYTYARFSDLTSRRDRCNCQPTEEDVKRCFWLEFDRSAFIIASTETHERMLQWYRDHVVWDNDKMNRKLLKYGIFTRIYTPMVIIQKLRESGIFASIL